MTSIKINDVIFLSVADIAVAIGTQVELLNKNGSLQGFTPQQFRHIKSLTFDEVRHQFVMSDTNGENDTIYSVQLTEKASATPIVPNIPDNVKVTV